jgi:RimJ/RimL family protein N-acetyltransferase
MKAGKIFQERKSAHMIRLEYFTEKDFDQLIRWIDTEELLTNWAGSLFRFPLTEESLQWYIADTNDPATSDAFVYKAVDIATGETVGHISLGGFSRKNRSARISRVLVPGSAKGKGICPQMIRAVCRFGFEELQLHRISLGVYDFNGSALRCYEKAGFVKEGVQRDILLYEGKFWSLVEMSMLESEWAAIRGAEDFKAPAPTPA